MDNFGYGELGFYGRSFTRGDATLWIDTLATGYSTWNFAHLFVEGRQKPRRSCPNSSVDSTGPSPLVSCGRGAYVAYQQVMVTREETVTPGGAGPS
jgi:hypothetical protein